MIIVLSLLFIFIFGSEKRGYLAAFLSSLVSVPLGLFIGVFSTNTICLQSSTAYCSYNIFLTVPISVILGYVTLLVVGTYIVKLQRHTPYQQSAYAYHDGIRK